MNGIRCTRTLMLVASIGCAGAAHADPEAFWRFEEGSAPALDSSGNGNTGTVNGATYAVPTPLLGPSNDFALLFDAKTDYVEIPAGPATNLDTFANGITLEAFVEPDELPIPPDGAGQRFSYIVWGDDDAYSLVLISDAAGHTTVKGVVNAVGGVTGPCTVSASAPFLNAVSYTHVAITYGSEVLRLYLDGVELASASAAAGCGSTVGPVGARDVVRIGTDETGVGFPANDRTFRGRIDEVRITGSVLAPEDFLRPPATDLLASVWSRQQIRRFDASTGALLDIFGSYPFLDGPRAIALGPGGDLYVPSQFTDDVRRFDWQTGSDLGVFASGSGLFNPLRVLFGKDRNLYVNSFTPTEVLRYDGTTGAFIDSFASAGLAASYGMTWGPDGNLYVVDGSDVLRYDGVTGAFIDTFTSGVSTSAGWIVFGPHDGHLYVSNIASDAVARYDGVTGVYIDDFVSAGAGGLDSPAELAFGPNGNLFVASFLGQEILEYDGTTGSFVGVFALPGGQVHGLLFVPEPGGPLGLAAGSLLLAVLVHRRRPASS